MYKSKGRNRSDEEKKTRCKPLGQNDPCVRFNTGDDKMELRTVTAKGSSSYLDICGKT